MADLKKHDYLLFIENDKVRAFDLGDHSMDQEWKDLMKETGTPILGYVYDDFRGALHYGETQLRDD